ncbi:MAG: hypothetical protein H3Z52_13435 [archaeon]|nr:hypothetical protein [archaeon]
MSEQFISFDEFVVQRHCVILDITTSLLGVIWELIDRQILMLQPCPTFKTIWLEVNST